ncbi:motility protein A [Scatolibacter rhodanostii]|uniref:motility protein A n=1 Tax=Scatolibacter rhodanostii TaxID=2014781 RepID=UPI001FA853F8|nr:motility protein A [Scatolibacter rhodanostii]
MKRSFDIASIIGFILAIGLVIFGIVFVVDSETNVGSIVTTNIGSFIDIPSVAIVFGGVLGCLLVMFPMSQFAKIPKHLRIIFMPTQYVPTKYIEVLVECARKAREKGLLALEEDANTQQDEFLRNSLQMVVDSHDPEKVKEEMESWLDSIDERHAQERSFYDKGAALGPAFGMIGTLIGLINMLKTLEDVSSVGPNMAVALVTTFYGSILANVIFAPISNKLRARNDEEYLCMRIICEGVQAIQAGENPNLVQSRLLHLLPAYKQKKYGGSTKRENKDSK